MGRLLLFLSAMDVGDVDGRQDLARLKDEVQAVAVDRACQTPLAETGIDFLRPHHLLDGEMLDAFLAQCSRLDQAVAEVGDPPRPYTRWLDAERDDWALIDGPMRSALWGTALVDALPKGQRVGVLEPTRINPDSSPWNSRTDLVNELLMDGLPDQTLTLPRRSAAARDPAASPRARLRRTALIGTSAIGPLRRTIIGSSTKPVTLALNQTELRRLHAVIADLAVAFPGAIDAILLDRSAGPHVDRQAVRFARAPFVEHKAPHDDRLEGWFDRILDAVWGGRRASERALIRSHLHPAVVGRWLGYEAQVRTWIQILERRSTEVVICSTTRGVGRGLYEVPGEAASRLDIPVVTLPHAMRPFRARRLQVESPWRDAVPYDISSWESNTTDHPTRGVFIQREYPAARRRPAEATRRDRLRVLFLVDQGLESTCLREAVTALYADPNIQIRIKGHPSESPVGFPEVRDLGIPLEDPLSDLAMLLESSDVVVSPDYAGSALIHVLDAGKPLVLWWRSRMLTESWAERQAYVLQPFRDAAETVTSAGELRGLIRRLQSDRRLLVELAARSGAVAERLRPSNESTLPGLVKQFMRRG